MDVHEPNLGARRTKLSLHYASKIKSQPKRSAYDAVFDMNFFDAIYTFEFRYKQFLNASNNDFSDILENPSYFVLPSWYIRPPMIVLALVHLKKSH